MVKKHSLMAIDTRDSTEMENSMEKENTPGRMDPATRDSFLRESGMGKAAGKVQKIMQIFILEAMRVIRKTAMEDMCGLMDAFTRVVLAKM